MKTILLVGIAALAIACEKAPTAPVNTSTTPPASTSVVLTRKVYTGTLDGFGRAQLIIPEYDLNDPPSVIAYVFYTNYCAWQSWNGCYSNGIFYLGLGIVSSNAYSCQPYKVVVIK